MNNVFEGIPANSAEEIFTDILLRPGVRIERIISTGQATPENAPYDQDHDEWVLLLKGAAGLWIDGEGESTLRSEEHTSELQSLMRISYAVSCLKKKTRLNSRQESEARITSTTR